MRNTKKTTHSIRTVPIGTSESKQRPPKISKQQIQTLKFIHRFRHVTITHVQATLGHSKPQPTHKHLTLLTAKGYLERHYTPTDRSRNAHASYYLTPSGLELLIRRSALRAARPRRSVKTDAQLSAANKARCHALADVYCYFKSHYNGHFEFFTAHDLTGFDYYPELLPDGYVRVTQADQTIRHYFIEIYGTARPTQLQARRLAGYLTHAESDNWSRSIGGQNPSLLILTASAASQARLRGQLKYLLQGCVADDFCIFTTARSQLLASDDEQVWHEVYHRYA